MTTSGMALASSNCVYSIAGLLPQNPDSWPSLHSWPRLIPAHTWYKKQVPSGPLFQRKRTYRDVGHLSAHTSVMTLPPWPGSSPDPNWASYIISQDSETGTSKGLGSVQEGI